MDEFEANVALRKTVSNILSYLEGPLGLTYVGEGRNRKTYRTAEGWVLKFPKNLMGINDNEREAGTFAKTTGRTDGYSWFAACEIYNVAGIPLLRMEWVDTKDCPSLTNAPRWTFWVDCLQVGRTADGTLVAYDYA